MKLIRTAGKYAVAAGVAAAVFAGFAGPASAANWTRSATGAYASGVTNAACDGSFTLKDTLRDGRAAVLHMWWNDGQDHDQYYRTSVDGPSITASFNKHDLAAVSVRVARDGGTYSPWLTIC
ncbi:hypothetical protein [Longispora albida]|uniref:hypothetical protein n=1 Tax=Longispora albida TaxID=203523 RepID=UPI0012F8C186|nr:hypothetical protein [Longispora albida]